jgi:AcrR family transcriptional regulator
MPEPVAPEVTGPAARPRRADARRNADRLLQAARAAVAEHGADASLDDIARRAGVGSGTLYRHFPTRQAMLAAVFQDRVETLRDHGLDLLEAADPDRALERWIAAVAEHARTNRGLAAVLMTAITDPSTETASACQAMHDVSAQLLTRAQRSGLLRTDLASSDLLRLINAIVVATEQAPTSTTLLLKLVMDGLRQRAS